MKKTVVLGASENPERYSFIAVTRLNEKQHPVVAVGLKEGKIGDIKILSGTPHIDNVHTITLYLNLQRQKLFYDYILSLNPKRIIFNPGAENPELEEMAASKGIDVVEGCTLVMLSTGSF